MGVRLFLLVNFSTGRWRGGQLIRRSRFPPKEHNTAPIIIAHNPFFLIGNEAPASALHLYQNDTHNSFITKFRKVEN